MVGSRYLFFGQGKEVEHLQKAMAGVVLYRQGKLKEAKRFAQSLKEHLTDHPEWRLFFDTSAITYPFWRINKLQMHVHTMEALSLIDPEGIDIEAMKGWLLKQKQTQTWPSTVATADAIYALFLRGKNLLGQPGDVRITLGDEIMETYSPTKSTEPVWGYVKQSFTETDLVKAPSITVENRDSTWAWGAVYASFDLPLNRVQAHRGALRIEKQLYVERLTNAQKHWEEVKPQTLLHPGDKLMARFIIETDRDMDFVHLKDERAACMEPTNRQSGYQWNGSSAAYVDIKDAATHFFFDHLSKGTHSLSTTYFVTRAGQYHAGIAWLECFYAPEYKAHSEAMRIQVAD